MNDYRRPTLPTEVYRDEQGQAIDYGNRWNEEPAPSSAYSRVSNLQRFKPLHTVADALIEWLQDTFKVSVEQDTVVADDLLHVPDDVVRAVRVVPHDPATAPLTFVLTEFPGVYLHAGLLHDFHFPVCGCDACDDDPTNLASELEWAVRTVVSGGYVERFDPWPRDWIEYKLDEPGVGMISGRSRTKDLPNERVRLAHTMLPTDGHWLAWQTRQPKDADTVD